MLKYSQLQQKFECKLTVVNNSSQRITSEVECYVHVFSLYLINIYINKFVIKYELTNLDELSFRTVLAFPNATICTNINAFDQHLRNELPSRTGLDCNNCSLTLSTPL